MLKRVIELFLKSKQTKIFQSHTENGITCIADSRIYGESESQFNKIEIWALFLMSRVTCAGFLKINLVNFNLPINEFINIDHNPQAIDIHEDETWINIVGDAAESTGGRTWVYNHTSLVFISSKLMSVTSHKYVYIQLPL